MNQSVALLLAIITVAYACKQDASVPPLPAGYVEIQTGKPVLTSSNLTVIADTIRVSICPKPAACFAPDNVSASLRLVRDRESQSVRLFAFFDSQGRRDVSSSDSTGVRLGGQLYKVILSGQYIGETEQSRLGRAILQLAPL
ncbi:hypothetical protein [Fibrella arboris]|uniref:hypothetical protein n=1 Tax=Fibrella arboris TaxID=3242486 RepID=UPI0035222473